MTEAHESNPMASLSQGMIPVMQYGRKTESYIKSESYIVHSPLTTCPNCGHSGLAWPTVSLRPVHFPHLAHMDPEGFRYYIPALMLSIIANYDPSSMRVICTLSALYPKRDNLWEYHMDFYSLLSREQCSAIAHYLAELPTLAKFGQGDQKITERALRNYWHEFL